jgi:hypothetical protein
MVFGGSEPMARILKLQQCKDEQFHKILETVARKGERILSEFKEIRLAIIPSEDLELLEKLEEEALDEMDAQDAEKVLRDPKWVPWDQVKQQPKP